MSSFVVASDGGGGSPAGPRTQRGERLRRELPQGWVGRDAESSCSSSDNTSESTGGLQHLRVLLLQMWMLLPVPVKAGGVGNRGFQHTPGPVGLLRGVSSAVGHGVGVSRLGLGAGSGHVRLCLPWFAWCLHQEPSPG